jgi:hypothetical protein
VVYDDSSYAIFRDWKQCRAQLSGLSGVFFDHFHSGNLTHFVAESFQYLKANHRSIFEMLPVMADLDLRIIPALVVDTLFQYDDFYPIKVAGIDEALFPVVKDTVLLDTFAVSLKKTEALHISPLLLRYIMETTLLVETFGSLDGMNVLEIGGGYGGMAFVVQSLYYVSSYTIVDLAICGKLQEKFLRTYRSFYPYAIRTVPSIRRQSISSDLLFSFYAISELSTDVVNNYIDLYVRHASSGYLQLNYDDDTGMYTI